uniref:Nmda receptor glutamate-binding chain n=1 Tax=Riptortus pedestris TaxID=329032 RepID=R4WRM9_RIPPE|nr:nmda receptor glutamate-binding chain [Riptortus pedestris]
MYSNQGSGYPSAPYPTGGYPNPPPYNTDYPRQPYQGPPVYPQQGYPNPAYPSQPYPTYPQGGYPPEPMSSAYTSPGEDPNAAFDFTEKSIRLAFIRKVYSILTVQLLIVVGFVALFLFEKKVQKYVATHYSLLIIALVIVFVLAIMMACCDSVRRQTPMNYICLFLFTFAFSFLVGVSAAQYNTREVMLAMGMTAAITLGLTLFAFQTKIDFTACGGALLALLLILLIGGIFGFFFPSRIWQTALAGFGAFLMSLYIVYDTQLMMGGKHKYALSPEEYVFAALNLYLDIVNLFLYILQIIGGRN